MSGVVNIITKSPRSMGNAFKLKAGGGERGTGFGNILYSGVRDDWSYRAGAGYSTQDAWDRPGPLPSGQPRDLFPNRGTAQPKFDIRVDKRLGPTSSLSFGAGYAGTGGIISYGHRSLHHRRRQQLSGTSRPTTTATRSTLAFTSTCSTATASTC